MLPEFPKAKKRTEELWREAMLAGMRSDPLLVGIAVRVQKEGRRACVDGAEMDYVPASVTHEIKTAVGVGQSVPEFYEAAEALGKRMGEEQAKHFFKLMEKPTAASHPFSLSPDSTFDDILAIWDKLPVRFKHGEPVWPTIVSAPDSLAQMKAMIQQALHDPASREKWQALVGKKRKEHDEREARRRLVD